jgi:hypothetical protein
MTKTPVFCTIPPRNAFAHSECETLMTALSHLLTLVSSFQVFNRMSGRPVVLRKTPQLIPNQSTVVNGVDGPQVRTTVAIPKSTPVPPVHPLHMRPAATQAELSTFNQSGWYYVLFSLL